MNIQDNNSEGLLNNCVALILRGCGKCVFYCMDSCTSLIVKNHATFSNELKIINLTGAPSILHTWIPFL